MKIKVKLNLIVENVGADRIDCGNKAEEGELVDSRNSNDRFTDDELAIAKSVDLCAVAESLGYTVKRIGNITQLRRWTLYESTTEVIGTGGQGSLTKVIMAAHR